METIQNLLPKALETLAPATPGSTSNTQALEAWSGTRLGKRLQDELRTFKTKGHPTLKRMQQEVERFCFELSSKNPQPRWLILTGNSGTGKTMLARIIFRFFTANLELAKLPSGATVQRLARFSRWGQSLSAMVEGDYSFIRDYKDSHLLILDDIGAEYSRLRELSTAKLYEVLNAREDRWTVITANLPLSVISESMDARIASRFLRHGAMVVDIDAPDYNL